MDLPDDIEQQLVEYIRLECGEDPKDPNALQVSDLVYDGEFDIYGETLHYWRCGQHSELWGTVGPFGDSYCLSMTSSSPKPVRERELYKKLAIEDFDRKFAVQLELEEGEDGDLSIPDYLKLDLPGEDVEVLASLSLNESPIEIHLAIQEGEKRTYIRTCIGISMSYTTISGTDLHFKLGRMPWN